MLLAIDMGNSNIVVGGIDDSKTYFLERITTDTKKTDLEYAVTIKTILDIYHISVGDIEGAILSSVVPPLNETVMAAIEKVTQLKAMLVSPNMKTGLKIDMDDSSRIGSDLIVDSVAAMQQYPLPLVVIDMGTATTMFVVDKTGTYVGGIIHPGLRVSLESLSNRTAQLPHIDLKKPGSIIAKNTIESMRSGILYGHAAMMDGCIDRMEEECHDKLHVIATGGLAPFVTPLCKHDIIVDEDLLLKGLLILYKMNK